MLYVLSTSLQFVRLFVGLKYKNFRNMDSGKVLVLDGGLSNELNPRVSFDVHTEPLWTAKALVSHPDAVVATHLQFLEAGADIVETASYQATLEGFKEFMNLEASVGQQLIKDSATLAKLAVQKFVASDKFDGNVRQPPLVAGSVGPYGVYLRDGSEYSGAYMSSVTRAELEAMHLPRLKGLVDGGVDLLAIETMPSLEEVEVILNLIQTHFPSVQVWTSFSIKEGNPTQTAFGDSMEEAYKKVASFSQAQAFGINCCKPDDVETFLKHIKEFSASDRRLNPIVYPNSGQKWIRGQGWLDNPVQGLDQFFPTWALLMGHSGIIGGCCQVGPSQISKLRVLVDQWNKN